MYAAAMSALDGKPVVQTAGELANQLTDVFCEYDNDARVDTAHAEMAAIIEARDAALALAAKREVLEKILSSANSRYERNDELAYHVHDIVRELADEYAKGE